MSRLTRNSLPSHSLQAQFHRIIKTFPKMSRILQGHTMQAFRDVVEEPNAKAVLFAEAICEAPFDNEYGDCLQCGHGDNVEESHTDDCVYLQAMHFLGREVVWVKPVPPKYKTKKVVACYLKPGMHIVVDDCACEIQAICASPCPHPAFYQVAVMTETGINEAFQFSQLEEVYILEGE